MSSWAECGMSGYMCTWQSHSGVDQNSCTETCLKKWSRTGYKQTVCCENALRPWSDPTTWCTQQLWAPKAPIVSWAAHCGLRVSIYSHNKHGQRNQQLRTNMDFIEPSSSQVLFFMSSKFWPWKFCMETWCHGVQDVRSCTHPSQILISDCTEGFHVACGAAFGPE